MNFLEFDIWSFLLIIGLGQGIFLCLALYSKKPLPVSLKILGVLLIILTANLAEFLLLSSRYYVMVPHLSRVTPPFLFLIGPLFYLFIKTQLEGEFKFSVKMLFHLIPFILALVYLAPWLMQSAEFKVRVLERSLQGNVSGIGIKGFMYAFAHIVQTLSYTLYALIMLKRYQVKEALKNTGIHQLKLLIQFNKVFIGYWINQLLGLIIITIFQYYVLYIDYVLALLNSLLIQFLSFRFLQHPTFLTSISSNQKYQGSSLSANTHQSLLEEVNNLLVNNEMYLDSELTLQKFSHKLNVNKNYISQVINQEFGYGFNEYINQFRIEHAKELFANPKYEDMKLFGIALESGFNNKTSFNRVFKKQTGKNPSEYRKSLSSMKKVGHN